jgi:hypothetical protein
VEQRLITLFTKGYLSEDDLDQQIDGIRHELFTLPVPVSRDIHEVTQAAISAGETLVSMSDYWSEATIEGRREMVWSLLMIEGLIYDLEQRAIIGLLPRADVLPVLALGLEGTAQWEQRDNGLWLRSKYLPDRRDQRDYPHFPPPQAPSLTPLQQYEVRQVAKHFGVSHGAIWRLMYKDR